VIADDEVEFGVGCSMMRRRKRRAEQTITSRVGAGLLDSFVTV